MLGTAVHGDSESAAIALLGRAEADADFLYAVVRTLVLATFWALFLAAADGHHHDTITATTLGGYTALTGFTWLAVWRGWRGRSLTFATVTADVLLTALQLGALAQEAALPATHLFTLPPSGLVFLVVAHAALRFDAEVVLYAGLAAMAALAGVMVLPAWEPFAAHGRHLPMADYWPILPLAILFLTTLVLWFVARRTRRLLGVAVREAQRAGRLARFFSPAVARRVAEAERGGAELVGMRVKVAILFIDIRGFTALAERMRPEELGPLLGEFRSLVTRSVFASGGTVDKFIGDGALAVFGAPEPRDDAAAGALACADAVIAVVAEWSTRRVAQGFTPVRIAIGAHYGPVFAGIVGAGGMLEFTVLGDTVNVAERLQRIAADNDHGLVVSDAFRRACGGTFPGESFESLGALELPGRMDLIEAWSQRDAKIAAEPSTRAFEPLLARAQD